MANCRCSGMEQCRKEIDVLRKQSEKRHRLERDIVKIQDLYVNLLPVRKECYMSIHKGSLDVKNVSLKKKPGGISENVGKQISQKRADIEAALNAMQEEDRQFHEEEERKKTEMSFGGRV